MGYLSLIIGCMFSQKTTELLRRIRRYESIGYRVLVINYINDTRYGKYVISTHDTGNLHVAKVVSKLEEIDKLVSSEDYDVVVIDEGQFFPDLYKYVSSWCDHLNLHVIVAGLSGDSDRKPFGELLKLIPIAEDICHLHAYCAVCTDGTTASFSKYIGERKDGQVDIGGSDKYMPVCRFHYTK